MSETFSERVDRERAETQARYIELYSGVAKHLDGWTFTKEEIEHDELRYKLFNGTQRINLNITNGVVRVSGYWPKDSSGRYWTPRDVDESSDGIGVSLSRGPEIIAKEITRRFLPGYMSVYAKLMARIQENERYYNSKREGWDKLVSSTTNLHNLRPSESHDRDATASIQMFDKSGYGTVRMVGKDSVQLDLHSLPVEVAIRVLNAIKG
jgi:hypothetical protein